MLFIEDVSYYVPQTRLTLAEGKSKWRLSDAQIAVFTALFGLKTIPVENEKSMAEMLKQAMYPIVSKPQFDKKQIRLLIHVHTGAVLTAYQKSLVHDIKTELALSHAMCFGMSVHNCSSFFYALEVASAWLETQDPCGKAMIICGEKAFTHSSQVIPNTTIVGDAAAAVLLSRQGVLSELIAIEHIVDGRFSRGIWMQANEISSFEASYLTHLSNVILQSIDKSGLVLDQIKLIIPHNINRISWCRLADRLSYPIERIYLDNISKYGHCFGADPLINYSDVITEKRLSRGDYFLMVSVGLGASFSAAVFQY